MSGGIRVLVLAAALTLGGCSTSAPAASSTSSAAPITTTLPGGTALPGTTLPGATTIPVQAGEPWIVYQYYDGTFSIKLIRPDGTGDHVLVSKAAGDPGHPDWSPDGERIAYVAVDDIWIVDVDGSNAHMVFDCKDACVLGDSPAWSPDGSEIAFVTADEVDGQAPNDSIEAVNVSTGALRTLVTSTGPDYAYYPRWAPDGQRIAVSIERFATTSVDDCTPIGSAVAVVDLTAKAPAARLLTDMSTFADYPDWSPDGKNIVYSTIDLGRRDAGCAKYPLRPSDLYVINPDGTKVTQLTHNASGETPVRSQDGPTASGPLSSQPTWSPDGLSIIFVQVDGNSWPGWTMAMIAGDGTGLAPATGSTFMKGTHPRLRPTS